MFPLVYLVMRTNDPRYQFHGHRYSPFLRLLVDWRPPFTAFSTFNRFLPVSPCWKAGWSYSICRRSFLQKQCCASSTPGGEEAVEGEAGRWGSYETWAYHTRCSGGWRASCRQGRNLQANHLLFLPGDLFPKRIPFSIAPGARTKSSHSPTSGYQGQASPANTPWMPKIAWAGGPPPGLRARCADSPHLSRMPA